MQTTALFLISILAAGTLLAGCSQTTPNSTGSEISPTVVEVTADQAPQLEVMAMADTVGGFNVMVESDNFTFTPEKIGQAHVAGEGYLEIEKDGQVVGRIYQPWMHLGYQPGTELTLHVMTNDQMQYQVDGEPLSIPVQLGEASDEMAMTDSQSHGHEGDMQMMGSDGIEIDAEEHAAHGHDHSKPFIVTDANLVPSVALEVLPDPTMGYNAKLTTSSFQFAPDKASQDETEIGEGHGHIYVNGDKISRVYGEWFYLPSLPAGQPEVKVNLNANSHNPYTFDGVEVADTVVVDVTE